MKLTDRLSRGTVPPASATGSQPAFKPGAGSPDPSVNDFTAIASRLHDRVIDRLNLEQVARMDKSELRSRLQAVVNEVIAAERIVVSEAERAQLANQILDEIVGHGPIEALLSDPTVTDLLVNGANQVWVERGGRLELTDVRFRDDQHLLHTIRRIVAGVGRRVDESSPMVDARLADGSRVNAIIPPLAIDGPSLSIRRFGSKPLTGAGLVQNGALAPAMLQYLEMGVKAHLSLIVAGGTGAGKTTLLNALSSFIPDHERIVTIEDAAELRLQQRHVVRLESRPPNLEGHGEVTIRDLVKNSLRMRPDRIVIGEVRGSEVMDMLQAMNTGHEGSLATLHANTAHDAISRLMTMLGMSGLNFSEAVMAQMISRAVHAIVHVNRYSDGKRRISSIVEVTGCEGNQVQVQEVFAWEQTGVDEHGKTQGRFVRCAPSQFVQRFTAMGLLSGKR